jgi:hypothetical protein
MKTLICFSFVLLFVVLGFGQPKNIWVDWECNMEIEILSGRFTPGQDTVAARGDFNGWGRFDMIVDPLDPNYYITPYPILFYGLEVGDTVAIYKFFYTPNTWETGDNKLYILTQDDYNNSSATISRPFNDATLANITNQETTIQFTVDCNNAVSAINGLPFPVINTCHIAGGTSPLQWPSLGWPDNEIYLMIPMYDDGTNGDPTPGDKIFNALVTFPPYTFFSIQYKYGINYGDPINNGGGNDNENAIGANHIIELEQLLGSAQVLNVFGTMGLHQLINKVYVPVELTSFTAYVIKNDVNLIWSTATELNNKGFEIERASSLTPPGQEKLWRTIGFIPGFGTTTETHSYSFIDNDIELGNYTYRLKQIDFDGAFEYSDEVQVEISIPLKYELAQNYPNPFNPSTTIKYSIPKTGNVQLKVYDIIGNEVATLINETKTPGSYEVHFNSAELATGVYIFSIRAGNFIQTRKMILLK